MHFYQTNKIPKPLKSGSKAYYIDQTDLKKRAEHALIISLITDMPLFGEFLAGVFGEYFWNMSTNSGVLISPLVPTREIFPNKTYPGDIDILVIPYENKRLILNRTLAIEAKAIRAKFTRQGKSPNQFGVSQTRALIDLGFPYACLAYLIVSDVSPKEAWRNFTKSELIDKQSGELDFHENIQADALPVDLLDRSFGRLEGLIEEKDKMALASIYLGTSPDQLVGKRTIMYMPRVSGAKYNDKFSKEISKNLALHFEKKNVNFINLPRHSR